MALIDPDCYLVRTTPYLFVEVDRGGNAAMGARRVDALTVEARSALMSRIRGKDTKPELIVRRLSHRLGYRHRLHRADLPGRPDLVFPSRRKIVFVHGCFWHRHPGCRRASTPTTRRDFWNAKFSCNVERDARKERELRLTGWDVLVIWECETRDVDLLAERLRDFLGPVGILRRATRQ